MDFNIEVRKKQLRNLGEYVKSSKISVEALHKFLGWNPKKALEAEDRKIPCPVNKNHLISSKGANKHIEKCKVQHLGYNLKDNFLSEAPENSTSAIKLDSVAKVAVLTKARDSNTTFKAAWNGQDLDPMTSDRLTSTFSGDERLALYDYCVKHTQGPPVPEEFTLSLSLGNEGPKELTLEEQLMQERNARKRRAKYKSVHTNRKNQTEIMREVIDNQMELYREWLNERESLKKQKLKEIEEDKDPFKNLDSSQEYHFIQVHTTYGDVSIPADVLTEPLPSFNLEKNEYVDKPPSPRPHSPQIGKRSAHVETSVNGYKRRSRENYTRYENEHARETRNTSREIVRDREQSSGRSGSRGRRRSKSRDRIIKERNKSRHRREETDRITRRSKSAEMYFKEGGPENERAEARLNVNRPHEKPYDNRRRQSLSPPTQRPRRTRSQSFEKFHRGRSREFSRHRRQNESPPRDKSPIFQKHFEIDSVSPHCRSPEGSYYLSRTSENYFHEENRRSMSLEREMSPFFFEEEIFEDDIEPYFRQERQNREMFFPARRRIGGYEMRGKPSFRGRGNRGRFNNFRARGRSKRRSYLRH